MLKQINVLLLFLAIGCGVLLSGQTIQNRFGYLDINKGLSHNTVNCILKDSRGLMWFGTNEGLNKFDGYQFTVYKHDPKQNQTISDNRIYAIKEDGEGNLWVGTRNGLNKYNRKLDRFERFLIGDTIGNTAMGNTFVKSVFIDRYSNIWVGILGNGLCLFSPKNKRIETLSSWNTDLFTSSAGINVSSVIRDGKDRLLFANNAAGLNILNPDTRKVEFYPFVPFRNNLDNLGKTIYEDHHGTIWVCTEGDGLYRFVEPENYFIHYSTDHSGIGALSNNIVKDIYQDQNNLYWIATDGGGLNIYDPSTRRFHTYNYNISLPNSISSNAIYTIFPDNNGIIWIGTFGGGVNIYDPNKKQFKVFTQTGKTNNELSHNSVLSFCEDANNNVWIGTDGGGVNVFNPELESFRYFKQEEGNTNSIGSNVVTKIYRDHDGILWFGTYGGGLNFYDPERKVFRKYSKNPKSANTLKSNNVWTIYEDSKGTFWVGTLEGVNIFDKVKGTFEELLIPGAKSFYSEKVTCMLEDSYGKLWLGGALLAVLDLETRNIEFPNKSKIAGYDIRSIIEDSKGQIWIGTEGGGLAKYIREQNTFEVFDEGSGLPSNAVHAILEDSSGCLWISTNKGLSKFSSEDKTFRNYDMQDGLQSNQFSYNAALHTDDGKMYFGGVSGFTVFRPDSIYDNKIIPPVILTDFRLMNQDSRLGTPGTPLKYHISETDHIELNHTQTVITLGFSALNYTSTEKNQYAYKMEGFDVDWNYVGQQRFATYTNLNAGDYVFRVRASNNDGVWNEEGASLSITILPPWWKTGWAYLVYALLMIGILFSFRNYLLSKQHLKNALVLKDLEKSKIEEINDVKLKFYTNISHELRTPLTLITGPLQKLMQSFEEGDPAQSPLKMIYRNAMRLSRLINEIMDFRKIETGNMTLEATIGDIVCFLKEVKEQFDPFAVEHQIEYSFNSSEGELMMCFDKSKVDIIVNNLLSNAFKFTPDNGIITLSVDVEHNGQDSADGSALDYVVIRVRDTGIGVKAENIDKIFERFYQLNDVKQPNKAIEQHGTGIGLALIKECTVLHRGKVTVDSIYGEGSVFSVRLPIILPEKYNLSEEDNAFHIRKTLMVDEGEVLMADIESQLELENTEDNKPVILVVEDNKDMRLFIRDTLIDSYNVLLAENGKVGLEIAVRIIPDLILSDVMMPIMGGFEMTQELRNDQRTNHIPIVFLSAINSLESSLSGLKLGAGDYIEKPFNAEVLLAKIDSRIENRKRYKEKVRMEFLSSPREKILESPDEFFLSKAIQVVETHISDPEFDVKVFYTQMGLSRSVLYRKLDAVAGQSVNDFVRTIRLKRAASLLKQNKISVSEVSYDVGFSDPQYFSKCFRKAYGMNPSKYAEEA